MPNGRTIRLSGKCGRCGSLAYREVPESIGEEAKTSCSACGQKLHVRVGGLPDRYKPDSPRSLDEGLTVGRLPPNVEAKAEEVLGVGQAPRPHVVPEIAIPARDAERGQVTDFDKGKPPEERG